MIEYTERFPSTPWSKPHPVDETVLISSEELSAIHDRDLRLALQLADVVQKIAKDNEGEAFFGSTGQVVAVMPRNSLPGSAPLRVKDDLPNDLMSRFQQWHNENH